ncbi:MAG: LON peptidase substrate-binding domain-containing protein [Ectothiorhodospiraceae bacterium]|nr:LON peptidase substrate-binding domain-containing protein [Ectothiorhodospiraceae bacterium]
MSTLTIPLFPLHAVLFPGGTLPLRIFEPRYLDMVSDCMKANKGFGVCLIREGSEVGKAADTYEIGTLSEICYFNKQPDGLLGITAHGQQRFKIISQTVEPNQLTLAEVTLLENEQPSPLPEIHTAAANTLRRLLEQLGYPFIKMKTQYDDASWVSSRLSELLPIRLEQKQYFLQLDDPLQRLERLSALMDEMDIS